MGSDACLLGLGHGAQQRNATFFVVVDTDTEVDLVRPRVGVEGFIEAEDRIARRHFDSREQTHGEGLEREGVTDFTTLASARRVMRKRGGSIAVMPGACDMLPRFSAAFWCVLPAGGWAV